MSVSVAVLVTAARVVVALVVVVGLPVGGGGVRTTRVGLGRPPCLANCHPINNDDDDEEEADDDNQKHRKE